MADKEVSTRQVIRALTAIGDVLSGYDEIEIVLVGGIAARFAGWIDPLETTDDCDVMVYEPQNQRGYVEQEAFNIGKELDLPPNWLNSHSSIYEWVLPPDWETRKGHFDKFGLLKVTYVGRLDFVTLKIFAGRDRDREHLIAIGVAAEEIDFAERHIKSLRDHAGMRPGKMDEVRDTIRLMRSLL